MELKDLYVYEIEDLSTGIVKADSVREARKKVYDAYSKFNVDFDTYDEDDIEIYELEENPWADDVPDVIEVSEFAVE